jgi:hypothetical protein
VDPSFSLFKFAVFFKYFSVLGKNMSGTVFFAQTGQEKNLFVKSFVMLKFFFNLQIVLKKRKNVVQIALVFFQNST